MSDRYPDVSPVCIVDDRFDLVLRDSLHVSPIRVRDLDQVDAMLALPPRFRDVVVHRVAQHTGQIVGITAP